MKSLLKLGFALITGGLLFASCSSENKEGKMVPKDAAFVIHVDGKSLTSKLTWDEIKATNWFKELSSDTTIDAVQKELMQDPGVTGIDDKSDFLMFMQMSAGGGGHMVIQGNIKDEKKFEEYFKKVTKSTPTKDGDISTLNIKEDGVLSWKGGKFVVVAKADINRTKKWDDITTDSTPATSTPAGDSKSLALIAKNVFDLKSDNSLAKDDKFSEIMKEEGDIHIYYNLEQMMKTSMEASMVGMMKLDKIINGTVSGYAINFDQGKIVVKSRFYPSPDLADICKKYSGGELDETMIKSIPSQNIAGMMAFSINPEAIREMIKLTGMDGMANMMLMQAGVSMDDIIKATKGDMLLSVSDLDMSSDTATYVPYADTMPGYKKPQQVNVLFATSIGDKPSFDKLMNAVKKMAGNDMPSDIAMKNNDKYFAVGTNPESVNKFLAGGNTTPSFWDKMKGSGFGMFIDLQKILKAFSITMTKDSSANVMMNESIKFWDNVTSWGTGFDDGALTSVLEINLMDKNTNSLKGLNGYIDRMAVVAIAEKKKNEERWKNSPDNEIFRDSIAPPAPVPAP